MNKILVITSCTSKKLQKPAAAGRMYTGMQQVCLNLGIAELREAFGSEIVDLFIVSAKYGVISEVEKINPYNITFNDMSDKEIAQWSDEIKIHRNLNELIQQYKIVFFLLGDKYLKAVKLPFESARADQKLIFFASKTSRKMIPAKEPYYFIEIGTDEARSFSYGTVALKGYLFKLLSHEIVASKGVLIDDIYADPQTAITAIEKYKKR